MTKQDQKKQEDLVRQRVAKLFSDKGLEMKSVSEALGLNHSYFYQYLKRQNPRALPEKVREALGTYFECDPDLFAARESPLKVRKPNAREIRIEELDVSASAGGGALVNDGPHEVVATWAVANDFLDHAADPSSLKIIRVVGDSMSPDLNPGDRVVVDTNDRTPSPSGMFAVWDGMGLIIKYCEYIPKSDPPTLRIISRNTIYGVYTLPIEDVLIQGRIVGKWQKT